MSTYEPGDKVLVRGEVIEHITGVGARVEFFSKTDQWQGWIREDLLTRGVLLDLGDWEHKIELLRQDGSPSLREIADQIEAQTKPPRIPEPGLWGVVEAASSDWPIRRWVHHEEDRWVSDTGAVRPWDALVDPALIRDGIEDAS